jgi:hypothetical protein
MAPTPGMPLVLDRTRNRLVNCTKELCPLATVNAKRQLVNMAVPIDSVSFALNAYAPLYAQVSCQGGLQPTRCPQPQAHFSATEPSLTDLLPATHLCAGR